MKSEIHAKVCIICNEPFDPNPKVGVRQKVCKKSTCKLQRKKLAQKHWLLKNPGYFKGRYPQLKDQMLANKTQKAPVKPKTSSGIQDEITHKITESKYYLQNSLNLVYKTS